MSVNYIDKSTGDLIRVAGQGKAEYGASTVRKGTVTVAVDPQQYTTVPVTFATPMPDADYLVDVSFPTQQPISYYVVNNRTKNGFQLFIKNEGGGSADASVTYTAFKLYTDTEYNNLLNGQRYSTNEVNTGKVWIDGKPIYRRVLTGFEITGDSGGWQTISGATIPNAGAIVYATVLRNIPGNNLTYFSRFDIQILSTGEIRILNLIGEISSPINAIILEYTKA